MKIRLFRTPRVLVATAAQGRAVVRGSWSLAARCGWWLLAVPALSVLLSLLLFPRDHELLARLHFLWAGHWAITRDLAWSLGTFGDYPTYNLPLVVALWAYGVWAKKSAWRRLAVICFLGATFAGALDDCLRLTLGRPRPDAHLPDGFYGMAKAFQGKYQSFPSGHAAAVFGASIALLAVDWPLGVVTTLFALLVVWARMELFRHYPSDVAVGSLLGISVGLLVGYGARFPWARTRSGAHRTPLPSRSRAAVRRDEVLTR